MDSTIPIGLSCTSGANYHHHGWQPGSHLHCKEPCDAFKNQAHQNPLSLCQGSSSSRDDRSTLLSNINYGCRHSEETTTHGKIRLAARNHGTAEVIPLSADELSWSVGHSCGVDLNQWAEKNIILHVMCYTSGTFCTLEHFRTVCFVHVLCCVLYLSHIHCSVGV